MWKISTACRASLSPHISPLEGLPFLEIATTRRRTKRPKSRSAPTPSKTHKPPPVAHQPAAASLSSAWTESSMYAYLSSSDPAQLPLLEEVEEMWVRCRGGHKFLCRFRSADDRICAVWVCDVLLYRRYPSAYENAKAQFVKLAAR